MSGPSRELPPLLVRILGDNSDAVKAFKGTVEAAKATAKTLVNTVKEYVAGSKAEFERDFTNYRLLQKAKENETRESYRRMKALDKAACKVTVDEDRKSNEALRSEHQKTVDFYKKSNKELNGDATKNYGRLTPAFKSIKFPRSNRPTVDLNALTADAEKQAKAAISAETKVMNAAAGQRSKAVAESRAAIAKQSQATLKEINDEVTAREAAANREVKIMTDAGVARNAGVEASRAAITKQSQATLKEINDEATARMTAAEKEIKIMTEAGAARAKEVAKSREAIEKQSKATIKQAEDEAKAHRDAVEKENKLMQDAHAQRNAEVAKTRNLLAKQSEAAVKELRDDAKARQVADDQKAKSIQNIQGFFAKANRQRLQEMGRELAQQAKNDAADIRARRARERAEARANKQSSGGGLGNRADIYMHSGALRSISGGIQNVLEPWAQLESHIATIKIFTGTIESARAVADDMQQFALVSPYSLKSVMEATALLMKFGQTSEDATATVKMLGDVAGGNSERLKHVALGVAQAVSLGRLQGQELRQMTEGGFNPLRIAAEHASGIGVKQKYTDDEEKAIKAKMAYFDDLMRKRKLDAKFVTAALKLTTSKGGRHAGAVEEQSKTPIGLATQIMESVSLVSIEAVKLFDKELRAMLTTVLETITKFIQWMKANKDLVAQIAITIAYVVGAMIAFHALGLVVAWTGWVFKTVALIYGAVAVASRVMIVVTQGLALAFTATGRASMLAGIQMAAAWIIGLGPIAWVIAGVTALMVAIWYLRSQNGLVGMFQDAMWWGGALIGFFTNFGHNMQNIFSFIGANWHLLLADMILTAAPILTIFEYMTGMDLRSMATGVEKGTKDSGYDMSMLKLDGPNLNPLSFLDGIPMPNNGLTVPEKPNINFEDYITAGKDGKHGKKEHVEKTRDHALAGSNEQAQRMYDYTQAMMGSTGATTKDNAPMKQVALLEQLVRNTQPDFDRGDSIGDMDID
jgi:hypothetical protein